MSATAPLKRKISTIPTDLARRRYFPLGCVVVHLISFTVFAHAALTRSYGTLALGGDGGFQFLNAMQQWMWAPFAIGFYSNPFQALGNVWFPSNTKLTPLYVIPALLLQSGGQLHIQPEYVIFCVYRWLPRTLFIMLGACPVPRAELAIGDHRRLGPPPACRTILRLSAALSHTDAHSERR